MFGWLKRFQRRREDVIIKADPIVAARDYWRDLYVNSLYGLLDADQDSRKAVSVPDTAAEIADRSLELFEERWGKVDQSPIE